MQFIEFQKRMSPFRVFSLKDVKKSVPGFSYRQLDRWKKKGYLRKIKQGFYSATDQEFDEQFLNLAANKIYAPSYISLEKALKFYGLIPEEIFLITSVSSKKTVYFKTSVGNFSFRHIKPSLFWGYRLLESNGHAILIAEPEKALLDYFYLIPNVRTVDDFAEMRINTDLFQEQIDLAKLKTYLKAFEKKALSKRVNLFLNTLHND